jgi:hypothetical protein
MRGAPLCIKFFPIATFSHGKIGSRFSLLFSAVVEQANANLSTIGLFHSPDEWPFIDECVWQHRRSEAHLGQLSD